MAIETSHFWNCKDTNTAKALCCHWKNFTLCNVSPKLAICCTLKTIESNFTWDNITFQCTLCNFFWQSSCHNHLIFHRTCCQLACCRISTMESHEGFFLVIVVMTFNVIVINMSRYCIINIQQSNCILANNSSDVLT